MAVFREWDLTMRRALAAERDAGRRIVFTNGCFDLLHAGHVDLLKRAKELGDVLVVGLNSDSSVRELKGPGRPFMDEEDRALILDALEAVDYVVLFSEPTPKELVDAVRPDVLVKGEDYLDKVIVGSERVRADGGEVVTVPLLPDRSSTALVQRVRECPDAPDEDGTGT